MTQWQLQPDRATHVVGILGTFLFICFVLVVGHFKTWNCLRGILWISYEASEKNFFSEEKFFDNSK